MTLDKEAFYRELDRLQESDDELDCSPRARANEAIAASSTEIANSVDKSRPDGTSSGMNDTLSIEPSHVAVNNVNTAKQVTDTATQLDQGVASIQKIARQHVTPAINLTNKRKRSTTETTDRSVQQVFSATCFFFVPNNDVHPARRLRIQKAIEFGTTWQRTWDDTITHVIVDKGIEHHTVLKILDLEILPPDIVLVNEDYPADCIAYRSILNPQQQRYQVKSAVLPDVNKPRVLGKTISEEPASTVQAHSGPQQLNSKPSVRQTAALKTRQAQREMVTPSPSKSNNESLFSPLLHADAAAPVSVANASYKHMEDPEFALLIGQARRLQGVALEEDDEDKDGVSYLAKRSSIDLTHGSDAPGVGRKGDGHWQDKFQCMQKHTGKDEGGANSGTIDILQQLADYYDCMGDEWRTRAYRKAISCLRIHPVKVCTKEQALELPQIGERIAAKIEEIAFTDRLQQLDVALLDPKDQVIRQFSKIYGVGFAQANRWAGAGHTTLQDLLEKATLTENQRIGVEHYEDFNTRIPRAEVTQLGEVVRSRLMRLNGLAELIVGGSYRRGAESSGDIDCIITHPTLDAQHLRALVLDQLVPSLTRTGFLKAELSSSSRVDGSKWLGACCLPRHSSSEAQLRWRRIDLLIVPATELGAALIYFTGNDIFNRSMRLLASKKGMRLNQRGLYKNVVRGKGGKKLNDSDLVEGRDEKTIFAALGVPWRPPEHRVC